MEPLLDSRPTAIATAVVVLVLFAALFFVLTTPSIPLLMFQLSSCATIVLLTVSAWAVTAFDQLSSAPAC
ncbi:hypothetical protein [Cupriavidus sp. WS]|uniref:hypothetical protein n=1 Tax=Cupriavidus sp. WS TaxID=1312922 RepID=UPI00037220B5|nr:hypothetical protein [Cupriavidus sp. WS]